MDDSTLTLLAVAACAVALLATVVATMAFLRLRSVRHDFAILGGDGTTDIARVAADQNRRIEALADDLALLREHVAAAESDVRQSLRNVAVVRYDAFGDMGGRLSFSAAIVDDAGDGLVISSIHARGESRTYAKGVVGGRSSITLTPEEQQALASATQGETRASATQGETRASAPTRLPHPARTKDGS